MIDPSAQAFKDEAYELLDSIENDLLELEAAPKDQELLNKLFRTMHTLKGSAAMFGFESIADLMHDAESVFDAVRNHTLAVSTPLLTLTLQVKDQLLKLLAASKLEPPELLDANRGLKAALRELLPTTQIPAPLDPQPEPTCSETKTSLVFETFWIHYAPSPASMLAGTNPLGLVEELSGLGKMAWVFHTESIPPLETWCLESPGGEWDILLNTDKGGDEVGSVFIFVEDDPGLSITNLGATALRTADLKEMVAYTAEPENIMDKFHAYLAEVLTQRTKNSAKAAAKTQDLHAEAASSQAGARASLRVDASRLDKLLDMVGELVIIQSRLAQIVRSKEEQEIEEPDLFCVSEDMERLMDEVRSNALSLRMTPIGSTFGALRRLIRDLCAGLGKEVDFQVSGGETEVDKNMIDAIKDPLIHILRNSVDHGIEPVAVRLEQGKPAQGTIALNARHAGGDVVITLADDGAGVDPEKVRKKARERGLIGMEKDLSDKECLALLFEPGFSTADKVSSVSGRGVGMDVVKRSIDALRGAIDLDSQKGKGTTLRLRLPLTLAIIDGLNVVVGQESFIIPLTAVEACQERSLDGDAMTAETIDRMGALIPCLSLRRLLGVPGKQPKYERVVIATVDGTTVGLAVDRVAGRQQAVIKRLGQTYQELDWISGASINGDGSISLILDVNQIVRHAAQRG